MMSLLFAALVACAPEAPVMGLSEVQPARGWAGEPTPVVIGGTNLLPSLLLGANEPVSSEFDVWLSNGEALTGVELLDTEHLAAVVPAGLEPGSYSLSVRGPSGGEAELAEAFLVTSTRADRLTITATRAAYELGEYAQLSLSLVDPNGVVVPSAAAIELVATSPDSAGGVEFASGQLAGQAPTVEGVGVVGALDPDGTGQVLVRSISADDVTFTATALGEEGVAPASALLSWSAGDLDSVEIGLPFSEFRVVAGEPFTLSLTLLDALGNPLTDQYARVLLADACDDMREVVDVFGTTEIELVLESACEVNRLSVFSATVAVESDPFTVLAADMAAYSLLAAPDEVEAGATPVLVVVQATDRFGNALDDVESEVVLSDSLGGLDSGLSSCDAVEGGSAFCTAWLRRAGTTVLSATDAGGLTGTSNSVVVRAGAPSSVVIDPIDEETIAGNEFTVTLGVYDAFGNINDIEPGGVDAVAFTDDTSSVECDWTGAVGDGRHNFRCSIFVATDATLVSAAVDRLGVTGVASEPIQVHNADLSEIELTAPSSITAGTAFAVSLAGYDTWGNPYVRQTDPVVDLADTTGTISASSATLAGDGQATVSATVTDATADMRIVASQYGIALGTSGAIAVGPGAMAGFGVETDPWVEEGGSLDVELAAEDAYGNVVASYTGTITLSTSTGACDDTVVSIAASGWAAAALECPMAAVGSVLEASDGTYAGESDAFDVVSFDCASGPVADLLIEGSAEPVTCLVDGEVSLDADASGSVAGSSAIASYTFLDSEGGRTRGTSASHTLNWTGAAAREVEVLVVAGDGCADRVTTWAWVGEPDGEPTGPVELSPSAATVNSGGSVTVDVAAYDCTGDVAASQTLLVRADLGEPALSDSGAGLTLLLDAAGEGSFTWSFPTGYAATATVRAGTGSTGAFGEAEVEVSQDSVRPRVIRVEPSGYTEDTVESIVVEFDEPLLASTVSHGTLTGSSGAVSFTASLDTAGTVLTVTPINPIDGATQAYELVLTTGVRDTAGNRLDGDWSGSAASFTASFGAVAQTLPTLSGCSLDLSLFFPDGDDGLASESDEITLTPTASASPAWWWLLVEDEAGAHVRSDRQVGTAATVGWNGRGDDGVVVSQGSYEVSLYAIDLAGNIESVCTNTVALRHRLELP